MKAGTLYVVATPIGNLGDMTPRAVEVLKAAGHIAAVGYPPQRGTSTPFRHLDADDCPARPQRAAAYRDAAGAARRGCRHRPHCSDAGTPLISDPGYHLVRQTREAGVKVVPIPGVSALIAALSVSGLPTDRFCFEGFLPAKGGARTARLEQLKREPRTLAFYEAPISERTPAVAVARASSLTRARALS